MAKNQISFDPNDPENQAMGAAAEEKTDDELEVAVGPEEEVKPEVVTLTPEEFSALKASSDSAKAVREGIEGLASKLGQPQVIHAPPANAPTQTPEEFYAEHADDFFDKEKGGALMAKHNEMLSERKYGPMLRGMSTALANTRKELLEAKDPYFKKYKTEVDALVVSQPPDIQLQPDIYERAWITVRAKHAPEIEAEAVDAKVNEAVERKLKELGIDPSKLKPNGGRPAAYVNSEGRSTPSISTSTQRPKARFPDAATKARLDDEAKRKGLDPEDLYRIRGYIQ